MPDGSRTAQSRAGTRPVFDVMLDLSGPEHAGLDAAEFERWAGVTLLRSAAGRVTVVRPGAVGRRLAGWWRAVGEARRHKRHLLVVLGPLPVGNEIVAPLLAELQADPMLGTAQPRFADARTDGIWRLPPASPSGDATLPRAALARLRASVITAEMLAACTLIRREVVAAMERPRDVDSVAGALALELARARRRGFRNVVVNRAVVASLLPADALYPSLPPEHAIPDAALVEEENRLLHDRQLERLLGAAYPGPGRQRRLLLDCRGLGALYNGTAQCMLGILDGFAALDGIAALAPGWAIHVQSTVEAATFHDLSNRYRSFTHHHGPLSGSYAAILLQNQPWSIEHVADLHRHGFLLGFNILDTISWDVLYTGPAKLDRTWRFVARHSDILTFISGFSRERFRRRFRVAPGVRDGVVYLSLHPGEQRMDHLVDLPTADHVLLFGNSYDHKGLEPAIRLLAAAFPFQHFVVLGRVEAPPPNVRVLPSGFRDAAELHGLVATARAIVYPSFYEGFGLPVIEGLAYGRPVLVRSSALWAELAAQVRSEAPLIEFEDDTALIERMGALLAGERVASLAFGAALAPGAAPLGWRDAAASLVHLVEQQLACADIDHWQARAESLRLAGL